MNRTRPAVACVAAAGALFAGCGANTTTPQPAVTVTARVAQDYDFGGDNTDGSTDNGDSEPSMNAYFTELGHTQLFPDLAAEEDYWLGHGLTVCNFLSLNDDYTGDDAIEQVSRALEEDGRSSASDRAAFVVQSAVFHLCPEERR